jgi:hypothetical protein
LNTFEKVDKGPPIGMVLKPTATSIRCAYPVDAVTDNRDDNGCGPYSTDPIYGSKGYDHKNWFGKMMERQEVIFYRNQVFGKGRPFESIPCSDWVQQPPVAVFGVLDESNTNTTDSSLKWEFKTQAELVVEQWSYIMGHPVCNQSEPAPKPDFHNTTIFLYQGHQVWKPEEWTTVVQLLEDALDEHPNLYVWNELVLDVPTGSESEFANQTVQAVFHIQGNGVVMDEVARRLARREARRINKPHLYVDLRSLDNPNEDLFHCSSEEEEQPSSNEDENDVGKAERVEANLRRAAS